MALKNYTTKIEAAKTVGEIQEILAKHGAFRVSIDYGEGGKVLSLSFAINDRSGTHAFRLPANADAVKNLLSKQKKKCSDEQAANVAWRNIKDWIDAQIALIETGQAEAAQVMMPYMLDEAGNTLYEAFSSRLLTDGGDNDD